MSTGVILLSFGEPEIPTLDAVEDYLTRIFLANKAIDQSGPEDIQSRARNLAERRAPALLTEYDTIGGSPVIDQVKTRASTLESVLGERGYTAKTYTGFQFTEPFIEDAVLEARANDHDRLVALPLYPLCGPSTTLAALDTLGAAIDDTDWDVRVHQITGWHRHPMYHRIRADNITSFMDAHELDLTDPETNFVFSAHGTPQHYVNEGSKYPAYVNEHVAIQAALLGLDTPALGFQNHENRGIPWTEPTIESVVATLEGTRVIVEPMSFIHEQSETLSELDIELRDDAEHNGLQFYRIPVPHDDDRFDTLFADIVEPFIAEFSPAYYHLNRCQCRSSPNTYCFNALPSGSDHLEASRGTQLARE